MVANAIEIPIDPTHEPGKRSLRGHSRPFDGS